MNQHQQHPAVIPISVTRHAGRAGRLGRLFLPLVLLLAALSAKAQTLQGDGTESDPYLVATLDDWKTLADNVEKGETGKFYKLTQNIAGITTMVGSENHPFSGTFLGDGHSLTLNYQYQDKSDAEQRIIGPFRFVKGATFRNLRIDGVIKTHVKKEKNGGDGYGKTNDVGGFAGQAVGTEMTYFYDCESAVVDSFLATGDATNGGFIGRVGDENGHYSSGNVTFSNCLFSGGMYAPNGENFGGFIGFIQSNCTATVNNSVVVADIQIHSTNNASGNQPFARFWGGGTFNITNSYYRTFDNIGTTDPNKSDKPINNATIVADSDIVSGKLAHDMQAQNNDAMRWGQVLTGDNVTGKPMLTTDRKWQVFEATINAIVNDADTVKVYHAYANLNQPFTLPTKQALDVDSIVTTYKNEGATEDITIDVKGYNKSLKLTVPVFEKYTVKLFRGDKQLVNGDEIYTNEVLKGILSANAGYYIFSDTTFSYKVTVDSFPTPVTIGKSEDGFLLIASANDWRNVLKYSPNVKYRLLTDLDSVKAMLGTAQQPFSGEFDGNHHTITLDYQLESETPENQTVVGLFRYVDGAKIYGLRTKGVIKTNKTTNDVGGLAGSAVGNKSTFNDCQSSVDITFQANGDATNGGLLGRAATQVEFSNCVFNGSFTAPNGGHSFGGFVGYADDNRGYVTIGNSLVTARVTASASSDRTVGNAVFSRRRNAQQVTVTNSYYNASTFGNLQVEQGVAIADSLLKTGELTYSLQGEQRPQYWAQNINGETPDSLPVLTNDTTYHVYRATFDDERRGKQYYAYANRGHKFAVPTKEQLGVAVVTTSYNDEPATADIVASREAYNSKYTLTIPKGEGYTVTVTRGSETLADNAPTYDTDVLVFRIKADEGRFLLTDSVVTIKGSETYSGPIATLKETDGYALIESVGDWNLLAQYVTPGNYRLTNNLEGLTTTIGDKTKPFMGSFDGQGHKLTVNYDFSGKPEADQEDTAPFRIIKNATIKSLRTAGIIKTRKNTSDAAGIVGEANGTVALDDCVSAVDITFENRGDATNAGLIGRVNNECTATINNCAFVGSFRATGGGNCFGGFIGWIQSERQNARVSISNSLLAADISVSRANNNTSGNAVFARNDRRTSLTITNCYYRPYANMEVVQGTEVNDSQLKRGETAYALQASQEQQHWGQDISKDLLPQLTGEPALQVLKASFVNKGNNKEVYTSYATIDSIFPLPAKEDVHVKNLVMDVKDVVAKADTTFIVEAFDDTYKFEVPVHERYTVTVSRNGETLSEGADVYDTDELTYHIAAKEGYRLFTDSVKTGYYNKVKFDDVTVLKVDTDGYLLIADNKDWDGLANNYPGSGNYRLAADIVSEAVVNGLGAPEKPFNGIFDGGYHTLTVSYDYQDGQVKYVAPFRVLSGATVKNLRVAGNITTKTATGDAAGLVGMTVRGPASTITNCEVAVNLAWTGTSGNMDATNGGFVGRADGDITINNSLFSGTITSVNGHSFGGFIGWGGGKFYLNNCVMSGFINVHDGGQSTGNAPFARNIGQATITNCYYRDFANMCEGYRRGTKLTDAQFADGYITWILQGTQTAQYWGQAFGTDSLPVLSADSLKHVYKADFMIGHVATSTKYANTGKLFTLPDVAHFGYIKIDTAKIALDLTAVKDTTMSLDSNIALSLPESERCSFTAKVDDKDLNNGDVIPATGELKMLATAKEGYEVFAGEEQTLRKSGETALAVMTMPVALRNDGQYRYIDNIVEWNAFAANTKKGDYRLTNDLDGVATIVGNTFTGVFDGQGHKLAVNYSGDQLYMAPFSDVKDATIRNLRTSGSIISSSSPGYCSGLVGAAHGNTVIEDCEVAADIAWNGELLNDVDAGCGALIGRGYDTIAINNCSFIGNIDYRQQSRNIGLLIGSANTKGTKSISISNTLVAGNITGNVENDQKNSPFVYFIGDDSVHVVVTNSYYRPFPEMGTDTLGTVVTDSLLKSGAVAFALQGKQTEQHWGQALGTDLLPELSHNTDKFIYENFFADSVRVLDNYIVVDEHRDNGRNIAQAPHGRQVNAKLVRSLSPGWNTLVLPFALTSEQVLENFGDSAKVAYFDGSENNVVSLNTREDGCMDIEANMPVLLYVGSNYDSTDTLKCFRGVKIEYSEKPVVTDAAGINFVGSYAALDTIQAGDYFIKGTSLWKSLGNTTIRATRAYFSVPADFAPAKLMLCIDGDKVVTAIDGASTGDTEHKNSADGVYTLSGQKVANTLKDVRQSSLKAGVYIVNGKKMVIE